MKMKDGNMKEYKLSEFVENPDNPQTVTDEAFKRLVEKIRKNPDGLRANRIAFVTDHPAGKRVVLSGNKRLRALIVLRGANGTAPAGWFQDITAMSEDERREFLVNSNICEGDWDVDKLLQQFDKDELRVLFGDSEFDRVIGDVCEKTGRVCRMMEMDEHYCDVIRKRWAEYATARAVTGRNLLPKSKTKTKGKTEMFEKVNPSHPDKVADRIAGALVDLAYKRQGNPRIAVEVLIGHGECTVIAETSVLVSRFDVERIVERIVSPDVWVNYIAVPQDKHLAGNQSGAIRCGDNGIFKGVPVTSEQMYLSVFARGLYSRYPFDGKFIIADKRLIICQSNARTEDLAKEYPGTKINPLGDWTGGIGVDAGATNRKLGSDMADSVTGGGLHGKDLSKADVSVNIYAWLKAQETGKPVELHCAIGDETVDGNPYSEIVEIARKFITDKGGFEKFAEWGLV